MKKSNVHRPPTPQQPVNRSYPAPPVATLPPAPAAPPPAPAPLRSETRGFPGWLLLPLRLFLGVTFIYAGLQKLTDPQYFNPSKVGFIGKQIIAFAIGSPIHDFLLHVALPHATFFGALVAFGELAIGLGALVGLLLRPAAFFGMLISLVFFLSASWRVRPYFYGADIVFVFSWLTLLLAGPLASGMPSLDAFLVPRFLERVSPGRRPSFARALSMILGVGGKVAISAPESPQPAMRGHARSNNNNRRMVTKQNSRRNFLWGLLTGGVAAAGIFSLGRLFSGDDASRVNTSGNGDGNSSTGTSATATPAASGNGSTTKIAVASSVPTNSAVNFTIPSSGDPGVLVHLSNGQFVAYDAVCTHAGCPVDYDTSSQHLLCPCHGAEFDPANAAAVVQGPTNTPLPEVAIHIDSATGAITLA